MARNEGKIILVLLIGALLLIVIIQLGLSYLEFRKNEKILKEKKKYGKRKKGK